VRALLDSPVVLLAAAAAWCVGSVVIAGRLDRRDQRRATAMANHPCGRRRPLLAVGDQRIEDQVAAFRRQLADDDIEALWRAVFE
jgi:hypothetical protein